MEKYPKIDVNSPEFERLLKDCKAAGNAVIVETTSTGFALRTVPWDHVEGARGPALADGTKN